MSTGILDGIRIVDLSDGIAGPVATQVLAEAGAEVVLVEPPSGVASRATAGFRTFHRSKRSVVIDLDTDAGRSELDGLLAHADVVVHGYGPTEAHARGLDDTTLAGRFPDLIACAVTGWPAGHPDADRPADDTLVLARLGICDEQVGHRDGPVFVRFPLGSWGAAWLAAIGIMSRLVARDRTGVAGPAHTSLVAGALVPMMMHWSRSETPSEMLRMGMPKDNMRATLFECADAWIHVMPPGPDGTPLMQELLAAMDPDEVAEANRIAEWDAMPVFQNFGANRVAFRRRPAQEWLDQLWANDVPVQIVAEIGDIYADEQARANGYVIELDDPVEGRITVPGPVLTLDPPAQVQAPAPGLDADRDLAERWAATPRPARPRPVAEPGPHPLSGLRVLDFGNFLAGPLGPMLLADLGAEVVKVETTTGDPMRPPAWPFAGCQRGKRAVALDLKAPASRPALDALLRWSDVVHHNLRLPAARRLGLDADAVAAVNPDAVFCHTSSYGPRGPRADWPGYDQLFQASCGWEMGGAGEGNPPMWHRFGFMDHLCAMSSAVATLLAVFHRDRTGQATAVAGSLLGPGALTNGETFVRPDGTLAPYPILDREQTGIAPGVRNLRCRDGEWVAVAARRPDEVERLCVALAVADPSELVDAAEARTATDLVAALAAAGVAAEAVRTEQRYPFFDDPANRAIGLAVGYPHREWGWFEQPGALWSFGDLDVKLDRAPPALGEHTVEVLTEVGLTAEQVDALLASGAAYAS